MPLTKITSLSDLYRAAEETERPGQVPILTLNGFTRVQRFLGIPTSNEKESLAIRHGTYPFAHATKMTHIEYSIFAVPYLQWIKERSREEYLE